MNKFMSRAVLSIALILSFLSVCGIAGFAYANQWAYHNWNFLNFSKDQSLVCNYDFYMQNKLSTIVPDISGHGYPGAISTKGDVRSYQILENEDVLGKAQWSFQPNGGYGGTYLEIPKEAFISMQDSSELTASVWVNLSYIEGYQRIFDFGTGEDNYLYVLNCGLNQGFRNFATAIKTAGAGLGEEGFGSERNLDTDVWCLVSVTLDENNNLKLYKDKTLIDQTTTNSSVTQLASAIISQDEGDSHCYVAASNYSNDPCTAAKFCDFRLYNRALTEDEIADLYYPNDQDLADADAKGIKLDYTQDIEQDFSLPVYGAYGSEITWNSDNDAVKIDAEPVFDPELGSYVYPAHVTRPEADQPAAAVCLSAKVVYNQASAVRNIDITIKPKNPDEELAKNDLEYGLNLVQGIILEGFVLPDIGPNGSSFKWESDVDNIIINEDYFICVERPAENLEAVEGKLYLTSTYRNSEVSWYNSTKVVPVDTSKWIRRILDIPIISVEPGNVPQFPNFVNAELNDGTLIKAYVKWPTDIDPGNIEQTYKGIIVGTNKEVIAKVDVNYDTARKEKQAELFDLEDIDLTGETFLKTNREHDLEYLKVLGTNVVDPSTGRKVMRILYNFYITFGLYNEEKLNELGVYELGGWEEPHGLLRGHSVGHYISALGLAYASTQDAEIAAILENITSQLVEMQAMSSAVSGKTSADFKPKFYDDTRPYGDGSKEFLDNVLTPALQIENWSTNKEDWGKGFISSYSPDQFVLLEMGAKYGSEGSGIWAPYYTLHKLIAGFLEAYEHAPNEIVKNNALKLAKGTGLWAATRICKILDDPKGGKPQLKIMWDRYIAGEYGGMNEVLEKVYEICKNTNSLNRDDLETLKQGSKGFDNISLFGNLTKNIDGIIGLHANQHIPQIIGSIYEHASAFEDGDQTTNHYFDIAKNFWEYVRGRYAYSTGGVGKGEKFTNPYAQAISIGVGGDRNSNCETCCVYNLLKLTAQLNTYDPENAEYMDYYEKGLYNQIFASQNPDTYEEAHNGVTYMLPIGPGGERGFGSDFDDFSCCCGTGMENHVKYQEATYFKSKDNSTLYVGLYLPTTLNWAEKGVVVTQQTSFPSETSTISVGGSGSFTMKLRVPSWATNGFSVTKNGSILSLDAKPSSYVSVEVSGGDVIVVNMPWTYHIELCPDKIDDSYVGSLMYGPFVMAAQNESTNFLNLYLQNDVSKSVENLGYDSRGLPIITTNGYTFYAMPSTELAHNPYHAYSKITLLDNEGEKASDFFYASLVPYSPEPTPTPEPEPEPGYVNGSAQTGDFISLICLLVLGISTIASLVICLNRKQHI